MFRVLRFPLLISLFFKAHIFCISSGPGDAIGRFILVACVWPRQPRLTRWRVGVNQVDQKVNQWEISRILKWRYVSTIFQAIFCWGYSLQFRFLNWPLILENEDFTLENMGNSCDLPWFRQQNKDVWHDSTSKHGDLTKKPRNLVIYML